MGPSVGCEGGDPSSRPTASAAVPEGLPARRVAVTFDDLPATAVVGGNCSEQALVDLTNRLLELIREHEVPATGLVTESRVCDDLRQDLLPRLLSMWLDAGHELGNHSFSHLDLNTTPVPIYEKDVVRGEKITRRLLGERGLELRYFRYPLLHTGPDTRTRQAVEGFLRDRGYIIAPVTIDNQEWVFAGLYARAKERGDAATMKRVADAFPPFMESVFSFYERWSTKVLGYEPPQVLLLHANELNADHFDGLAEMMRGRGYEFVSLASALGDPAYGLPDGYVGRRGLSWLHRWALAKGMELEEEPREPEWIAELFQSY
jgi:peptidoglycan/xylan/chitin deacetylase (PgdA/CDA1 family)